jgi:hypothetical protein
LAIIVLWVVVFAYGHKLGHLYSGELEAMLNSHFLQVGARIIGISLTVILVWISLPLLPTISMRSVLMIVLWAALLAVGHHLSHHAGFHQFEGLLGEADPGVGLALLILSSLLYLLVIALPFVPGVEIGLLIMMIFGLPGVLAAYLATVGGIVLAFAVGRVLPGAWLSRRLEGIGLTPEADAAPSRPVGAQVVRRPLPARLGALLVRHRHIALAVALNLPGNSVLGGGGGIGLLCGAGRAISWSAFAATVAVAVAPVPVLAGLGLVNLEPFLESHGPVHDVLQFLGSLLDH